MSEIEPIKRYICPSCASDPELQGIADVVEYYDDGVIRMMDYEDGVERVVLLFEDERAIHRTSDDQDVEIECYI